MILDLGSFAFGSSLESGSGTPSWGTSIGQGKDYKITYPGANELLIGMIYMSVPLNTISIPLGKGGHVYKASEYVGCQLASLFRKVYVNGREIGYPFAMLLLKEDSDSHSGRKTIKYSDKIEYQGPEGHFSNQEFIRIARDVVGLGENACWFIYKIEVCEQDELHLYAGVVTLDENVKYLNSEERKKKWLEIIPNLDKEYQKVSIQHTFGNQPLQQIFYGAPGTGKSNTIKREVDDKGKKNFRTTFHPDSDYSTFVGAYKPTMDSPEREYSLEELVALLKETKLTGTTYPCHKFAAKYWKSLKNLSAEQIKQLLQACGFTDSMNVEISKGIAIGEEILYKSKEEKIVYRFTPQAFTKAYTAAWNTEDDVYLIIEEINRGNCAQIFGDLFQLLDRKEDGFSEYPIDADTDLAKHLEKELANSTRTDFPEGVKEGKKLVLPSNLYIWATMNTSDQSLFPIDSAFKRRWDWKYIPIAESEEHDYLIEVNKKLYKWWSFVEKMNRVVEAATQSEDKKMGYFFCKPDKENETISADRFVSKVLFYLYNDVFKDNGLDWTLNSKAVFKYKEGENEEVLTFAKYFNTDGGANGAQVEKLLKNLDVEIEEESGSNGAAQGSGRNYDKFMVNGQGPYAKKYVAYELVKHYIEKNGQMSAQDVINNWKGLGVKNPNFVIGQTEFDVLGETVKERTRRFDVNGEAVYVTTNLWGDTDGYLDQLEHALNQHPEFGNIERVISK